MDDNFKLSGDDTMRRLRSIAQTPGELQWRLELLATLERQRIQADVNHRGIMQVLRGQQKILDGLSATRLAALVNAQIEQKRKDTDSGKWRATTKSLVSHLVTALFAIGTAVVLIKVKHW